MRALLLAVVLGLSQPYQTTTHVLIPQQPDSAKALRCPAPLHGGFAAGCASFTSSTANVLFPTRPAQSVQFRVEMVAHDAGDAVRLRAFRWAALPRPGDDWTVVDEYWPALAPSQPDGAPLYAAPRSVGAYIDPTWWNTRTGQWTFVLELRGRPTIHGAQIIEIANVP